MLFRINAQSEAYEEALAARGIPYVVRGAARFFDRGEVREAVTRLRGAARGGTTSRGDAAGRRTRRAVGDGLDARGAGRPRPDPRPLGVPPGPRRPGRRAGADRRHRAGHQSGDFVDDLDRRASEQHAPVAGGVTLATLHAAKGLEWDAVFVVGVCEGTLPITYAESPMAVEEERRLLVRRHHPRPPRARRLLGLGPQPRRPSHPQALPVPRPDAPRRRARSQPTGAKSRKVVSCRECGKPLATGAEKKRGRCADCPASYDEALFEQLRTWRSGQAAEESVPAYVVFTDATLQLIAEHKPRSAQALLRINGIGQTKLDRYGDAVLGLVG